jgi:hypothetical protein
MRRALALCALAAVLRGVVAALTCVPARDAESYLWMAREVAHGHLGAAFATVFHPLYPLLVAALVAAVPGMDLVTAGQVVACACAALATLPLFGLTRSVFGERAAWIACTLYAVGVWFVRHPADCLSEGPFFLAVAASVAAAVRERRAPLAAGLWAGLAYGLRPEGASLLLCGVPWLALAAGWRAALAMAAGFVLTAWPWPLGWAVFGDGLTLTPKAAFNWVEGAGGEDDLGGGAVHWLAHALRLPGAAFEAIGYVAFPLAVAGALLARPRRAADPAVLLLVPFLLQCAVVPFLRSNSRFLVGYGMLLLPFAGLAAARAADRLKGAPRALVVVLALAVVLGDVVRIPQVRRAERVVERELGEWLGARLGAGESIATDMPRLSFYAGLRPGPPRAPGRDELLAAAAATPTRFVAVVAARSRISEGDLRELGLAPIVLPDRLSTLAAERGVLVFAR